ncbi:hypothetical protein [Streptacidiphilus sp. MAP5-52]|uniref:hypothetical protein n=1 Tax=Streptacidiphilus sp. MAP5-52 TaxID=3156267 RepID=UPI003513D833
MTRPSAARAVPRAAGQLLTGAGGLDRLAALLRALGRQARDQAGPLPPDAGVLLEQARQAQAFIRHCAARVSQHTGPSAAAEPVARAYSVALTHGATVHRDLAAAVDLALKLAVAGPPDNADSEAAVLYRQRGEQAQGFLLHADECAAHGAARVMDQARLMATAGQPVSREARSAPKGQKSGQPRAAAPTGTRARR